MKQVMTYLTTMSEQGMMLQPDEKWDGSKDFEFEITVFLDSDFFKDPVTRKSVCGWAVFLKGAPILMRSKKQDCRTLSIKEVEVVEATSCAQDIFFFNAVAWVHRTEGAESNVADGGQQRGEGLGKRLNIGRCMQHIEVWLYLMRELK